MKFIAPMEAAMKQTLHSFPFNRRSNNPPESVKTPTSTAPARTGLPTSNAPRTGSAPRKAWASAQKQRTPVK
eukprot:Skav230143  [mRNA]  locus=scaffold1301:188141:188356:+ [translate_table: standard]